MTVNDSTSRLTPKQDAVALALARGCSFRQAAAECKIGERTIFRWQASLPGFTERIRELRSAMFDEAVGRLAAAQVKAANVLDALLDSENEAVRRQASRDICSLGLRAREVHDLTIQIAELRRTLEKGKEHG